MTARPMRPLPSTRGRREVIVQERNLGKGEAIKAGLRYWLERGFQHVIILDADGQHLPEEIARFIAAASSGALSFTWARA